MPLVHGLAPILATPFASDGSLDLPSLRRVVEFNLRSGVDGLAVSGMASETFALTADERARVLREVVDVAAGAVPVVSGVNATSTVTAVEQARAAAADGAAALMVLPPYMVKPTPAQLVDFYAEVAAATDCEVMVQDAPGVTGVAITPATLAQLSKLPGVTSVKVEAPPTPPKVTAVVETAADDGFVVLGGMNAQFCLDEYARGAVGTMPACEFPDLLRPVLDDWAAGRRAEARAGFARLLPLILHGLQQGWAWAIHKEVLVARGLIADATVRAPARPLDAPTRAALHEVLAPLGITPA
ncbi:dihydrodipicolinate synthase family protein [Streptomyces sp. DSM 44915]|uniref:Dihydrodipicolinate synthase family protein n=1 Tax=Streptomyces chisholmiae TaxID=3075540 RepID=A0ABU2JV62_9ACTN|nr:dihydrodipicolinate synthase family protein [Streptomyces sp. DSM 44915]MDT0268629.1 dihydrodipicolinate synthase family protein [Streptomyces sp. DSM 44915]